MSSQQSMPEKTREIRHRIMDSTIWNDFAFRDDDIVIGTWSKSGTTWLQQIVSQLIFQGQEGLNVAEMSPWVDMTVPPRDVKLDALEAQTHRRFVKTHLPVDALVFSPSAKYIYVARDGRDVVWSLYNHHANFLPQFYEAINGNPDYADLPPVEPPPASILDYFDDWLEQDGYPFWSFWDSVRSWWSIRDLPNVRLQHFAKLKEDMASQIRGIAEFLRIPIDESVWPQIVEHCSFDYMKEHAQHVVPLGGSLWEGGPQTFIHRGVNGRWQQQLTAEQIARYEACAEKELGAECAQWLATGQRPST